VYLLDSSAIARVLGGLKGEAVKTLDGKITLDLARYELGNVIWKQSLLEGRLSLEEAVDRAGSLAKIFELLEVRCVDSVEGFEGVMKLAVELGMTFYDAAYLYSAKNGRLTLVTEDGELVEKASLINVETLPTSKLVT